MFFAKNATTKAQRDNETAARVGCGGGGVVMEATVVARTDAHEPHT